MKPLFTAIFFILSTCSNFCNAQAKSVYFELGGPGLASANFDIRFQKTENGFGGRIGVGGFSINDGGDKVSAIFLPIGVNYLFGNDEKNYFEIGGGFTPVFLSASASGNNSSENFTSSFGHLNFGYRLQPKNGGFLFRAGIVPIFGKGGFIPYYAGLSFGYKF
jgi:hypothetical protein